MTRPSRDELERYRKLLEDLALVNEAGHRLTLTLAETQVANDERQALLLHVAMAMRAASRANLMIREDRRSALCTDAHGVAQERGG